MQPTATENQNGTYTIAIGSSVQFPTFTNVPHFGSSGYEVKKALGRLKRRVGC